jgi:FKBP-type peptidyl-prolyl cis-trans isomerase 2
MAQAKTGDRVKVHYRGTLEDGAVFDSSFENEPIEFTIGERMLIPCFENAVIGMGEGDTRTISIPPEDAYGHHMEELVMIVKRSQIPPNIEPKVGMMLQGRSEDGAIIPFTITGFTEDSATLDGNHPLAGKRLVFEIRLIEII